jgi:HSP20 family protein
VAELNRLQQEVARLFETPARRGLDSAFELWKPAVDVTEEAHQFVLHAELPGLKKEDLQVSVEDGIVSVSGERGPAAPSPDNTLIRSERFTGRFHRAFSLPVPVEAQNARATFEDGILRVFLPKREEAKPRRIQIEAN